MSSTPDASPRDVLVVPVGGSPEAPRQALLYVKPTFVAFVVSPQTRDELEAVLAGVEPPPVWRRLIETPDPQDLAATFKVVSNKLPRILDEWRVGWERVVVDLTGGTKVMTSALALATVTRASRFLYVGGDRRGSAGVGVVESGAERPISQANPWDLQGVTGRREVAAAFNRLRFTEAAALASNWRSRVDAAALRREFDAVASLAGFLEAWDRFDYQHAVKAADAALNRARAAWEDVPALMPVVRSVEQLVGALRELVAALSAPAPSRRLLADLLANARRRADVEGRYDDAVARLYRCVEGFGQCLLWERHQLTTAAVPVDWLPNGENWDSERRFAQDGRAKIGLQKVFRLLTEKGHSDLAAIHARLKPGGDLERMLRARNHSLLAHGLKPVTMADYDALQHAVVELLGSDDSPPFPRLPEQW